MSQGAKWSADLIASAISRHVLDRRCLVVPRCNWTGYECDLLVVEPKLRIIDVEIKISRSDLKADEKKGKWWHRQDWRQPRTRQPWPLKVWKHYVAIPKDVYEGRNSDGDLTWLPSPASGLILFQWSERKIQDGAIIARVVRRAKPNTKAEKISPESAVDIARLACLRAFNAYELKHRKAKISRSNLKRSIA